MQTQPVNHLSQFLSLQSDGSWLAHFEAVKNSCLFVAHHHVIDESVSVSRFHVFSFIWQINGIFKGWNHFSTWLKTNMREHTKCRWLSDLVFYQSYFKECLSVQVLRCGFCKDSYLSKSLDSSCEGGRLEGRPTGIYMSVRALHGQRRSCDLLFNAWCNSEASQLVSHLFPLFSTWTLESALLVSLFLCTVALWQTLHRVLTYKCLWLLQSFHLAILPSSSEIYNVIF